MRYVNGSYFVLAYPVSSAQFAFLKVASASSAPSNTDLQNLLKPTSDKISTIQSYREKNRTSPFFNHLSAISESIPALGWVCVVGFSAFVMISVSWFNTSYAMLSLQF